MEFKDVLKELRIKRGYSQVSLAKALGVSKSLIGAYETGDRKPSFESQEEIADFFNVSIDYLLGRKNKSTYYLDPEAAEAAKEMYERPELKVLFDASRNVTKEDILSVASILEKLKKDQFGDED